MIIIDINNFFDIPAYKNYSNHPLHHLPSLLQQEHTLDSAARTPLFAAPKIQITRLTITQPTNYDTNHTKQILPSTQTWRSKFTIESRKSHQMSCSTLSSHIPSRLQLKLLHVLYLFRAKRGSPWVALKIQISHSAHAPVTPCASAASNCKLSNIEMKYHANPTVLSVGHHGSVRRFIDHFTGRCQVHMQDARQPHQ